MTSPLHIHHYRGLEQEGKVACSLRRSHEMYIISITEFPVILWPSDPFSSLLRKRTYEELSQGPLFINDSEDVYQYNSQSCSRYIRQAGCNAHLLGGRPTAFGLVAALAGLPFLLLVDASHAAALSEERLS